MSTLDPAASLPPAEAPALTDLGRILAALRAHLTVVLAITALTVVLTAVLVRREERAYRATAVVRLADARRALTTGIEDPAVAPERLTSPLLSQIQLLRSRGLIGRVVDSLGLRLQPDFSGLKASLLSDTYVDTLAPTDTLAIRFGDGGVVARSRAGMAFARYGQPLQLGGVRFTVAARPRAEAARWPVVTREKAIDNVLRMLKVTPRVSTNVVDVTFTAPRAVIAQRVVNAVVEGFRAQSAQAAQQQSRRRRLFLETQLRQTDSLLSEAQLALTLFRKRAQAFSSRDKLSAQQRDLMALDAERGRLEADRWMYNALLARLRTLEGGESTAGLQALMSASPAGIDPVMGPVYERLTRYQTTRDSLTTGAWRRSTGDPDVRRLDELIASMRAQLITAVGSRVTALGARIAAIDEQRSRNAAAMESLPGLEAEEVRLTQRVETVRRMGEALRQEHQKARITEAVEVGEAEIVDLAGLPYRPVSRLLAVKLALGLMFGFGLGGCAALLLERRNTSVQRREELEQLLRVPSLATIPRLALAPRNGRVARRRVMPRVQIRTRDGAAPSRVTRELITLDHTPSLGSEAYRALRTNLLFAPGVNRLASIVVTSAAPMDGKTTVAANLAVTFAREGQRVLLADCDLRRARLHELFGVPRHPGLAQVLRDPDLVPGHIRPTSVEGLHVLPCGDTDGQLAEPLRSDATSRLLRRLSDSFDLVVFDTPPVLAVADALILAGLVDGVLLVVRAGHTDRAAVQDALQRLAAVGARVLGTVLTDADREHEYRRYYAAYTAPAAR